MVATIIVKGTRKRVEEILDRRGYKTWDYVDRTTPHEDDQHIYRVYAADPERLNDWFCRSIRRTDGYYQTGDLLWWGYYELIDHTPPR